MSDNTPDILPDRVIDESTTRIYAPTVCFQPFIKNPLKVVDDTGHLIGGATLRWSPTGGILIDLYLNPNTPEAFELEVNRAAQRIEPHLSIDNDGLDGVIVIK